MIPFYRVLLACGVAGVLCYGMYVCVLKSTPQGVSIKKCTIVCTTCIIADAIKNIVGDNAHVYYLMGPGVDPHLYKARAHDVEMLAQADIIFLNGHHLEGKMADVLSAMTKQKVAVALAECVQEEKLLLDGRSQIPDPHIWHDVLLWKEVVVYATTILSRHDRDNASLYQTNAQRYCQLLDSLDQEIKQVFASVPQERRILVTAHDAFNYFGKAYNIWVMGLQGISTDAHVSTKDVYELAHFIIDHKITTIFAESSVPERDLKAVQQAVQASGWQVALGTQLYSDSLGIEEACNYINMMRYNVAAIVSALNEAFYV